MHRLVSHGFLDISLNDTLSNLCDVIPHAREIARIGREQTINGKGWRFLDRALGVPNQYVGWHIAELYREGTYGKIYRAMRMIVGRRDDGRFDVVERPHEVIVKQTNPHAGPLPTDEVTAHISEALLHVLAWHTMQQTLTPWSIPQPYEVFGEPAGSSGSQSAWKTISLSMSYVQGRTMYSYLQKTWKRDTKEENGAILLEMLAQLAYILYHMQRALRLNHRDVKVNNIMIRQREDPLILELDGVAMVTQFEVTLIDFGFACVGCPPPRAPMTVFQAGSWFPMGDLCCKLGRDLAQLLYCIHCYFPLEQYLPIPLYEKIHGWMQIPWSGGVANALAGFNKDGKPKTAAGPIEYDTGIYEFLRRPDVDPATCEPLTMFKACARLMEP
jgi:serine/threonine protein kinase